jgi:hypothetical protein
LWVSVITSIAPALSRRRLTPFASMCIAVTHATTYSYTSTKLPNVIWTGDSSLSLEGQPINFPNFCTAMVDTVEELATLIPSELLMGLSPEELGFNITETTHIYDDPSDETEGYSCLSDIRNNFAGMKHVLPVRFTTHAPARPLFAGINPRDRSIIYADQPASTYLAHYVKATRTFMFIMHGIGGQCGRGTKFVELKVYNPKYRVRNFFVVGPGRVAYVLFYNKTTGLTGLDRIVAHGLPWKIGRLLLIMLALVNPFASVLVERIAGARG